MYHSTDTYHCFVKEVAHVPKSRADEWVHAVNRFCLQPFWTNTTTIQGIVQDAQGGGLPGVTIIVENPGLTRSTVTVLTDDQGRYNIPGLQAATYVLRAQSGRILYPGIARHCCFFGKCCWS